MPTKFASAAFAVLAIAATAAPAFAATTTLRATTCLGRNNDETQAFLHAFVAPLNARKADVKVNYLGGPEVTPGKEQASALKRGLIDMIMCPASRYAGMFGEARIVGAQNVPISEIRKNGAWQIIEKVWGRNLNAHFLAWAYPPLKFYTYFTEKPKLSKKTGLDLHGMKIRSTPTYNPFLRAMGATTVDMSPGDVYAALQRGVVSGFAWPWGSVSKYGWQKFLKYRVKPSFFGPTETLMVNLNKWNGLTDAERKLLDEQARLLEHNGGNIIVKLGKEDDAKLKQVGVKDIVLKGDYRKAYLRTIYAAKWAQNDALNKNSADYKKLKALVYHAPTK